MALKKSSQTVDLKQLRVFMIPIQDCGEESRAPSFGKILNFDPPHPRLIVSLGFPSRVNAISALPIQKRTSCPLSQILKSQLSKNEFCTSRGYYSILVKDMFNSCGLPNGFNSVEEKQGWATWNKKNPRLSSLHNWPSSAVIWQNMTNIDFHWFSCVLGLAQRWI